MKKNILLLLFCISLTSVFSQTIGITTYTSSYSTSNTIRRQPVSQSPNGDIWMCHFNGLLVKFSGNSFTTYTISPPNILPTANIFATNNAAWYYSDYGDFFFFNGTTFTDFSSNIAALIGTISSTNPINYIGSNGTDILIASNKGIIKYNGSSFSVINTANSNLSCDTVNCILNNGTTTYIGTDKGLCTYNGTSFSALIPFTGAASHQVNYIFSNGVKTIVTRKSATADFEYYNLNSNTLTRMAAFSDSIKFSSKYCCNLSFINNKPAFPATSQSGPCVRLVGVSGTPTNYVGFSSSLPNNVFIDPSNTQKFYEVGTNSFIVNKIDLTNYASIEPTGTPDQVKYLDTNNVSALISGTNVKHWDAFGNGNASYRVPKGPPAAAVSSNFATALWIGGLDNTNQLHVAAQTYRQNGSDFWPGPIDTINAQTTITNGQPYNKVWKISCNQINQFANNYNSFNLSANASATYSDINTYIANGNNSNNFAKQLSSYKDWNNNGLYEPSLGEYPLIKGHQQIYSVYNDAFSTHTETGGLPLGIEVHDRSFAYNEPSIADSMKVINNTTFIITK